MKHCTHFLTLVLIVAGPQLSYAHDPETHVNITREAVVHLKSVATDYSCLSDDILSIGARREDDLPRPLFHFLPTLTNANIGITCDSLTWGFSAAGITCFYGGLFPLTNEHTWYAAIEHATDPATGRYSEEGLRDLGYVLHLLEDLTSPAHVRNDPHPDFWPASITELDPVEAIVRNPSLPAGGIIAVGNPEVFFSQLQQWTQANFFSKDTCFSPTLLGPTAASENSDYFFDETERKIAYKGLRYKLSGFSDSTRNKTWATIDDVIADEQFEALGPKAVLYVSSLLFYYLATVNAEFNVLKNGSFETGDLSEWNTSFSNDGQFPQFAGPDGPYVRVVSEERREGGSAVRVGRWDTPYRGGGELNGPPQPGAEPAGTDILSQEITLPAIDDLPPHDKSLTLGFSYNVKTYDAAAYSWFDVDLFDAETGNLLASLIQQEGQPGQDWGIFFSTGWKNSVFDLTPLAGRRVRLQFGSHQDGYGDQFTTYIDRVVVKCGSETMAISLASSIKSFRKSQQKARGMTPKELSAQRYKGRIGQQRNHTRPIVPR